MGLNSIGFALNSNTDDIKDIMDKLNIVIEGPLETTNFEDAISNSIEENDIFFTKLENGILITTGVNFPITEEGYSVLSANNRKYLIDGKKYRIHQRRRGSCSTHFCCDLFSRKHAKNNGGIYSKKEDWQPYAVEEGLLLIGQSPLCSELVAKLLLEKLK